MITVIENPPVNEWPELAKRPHIDLTSMLDTVREVFDAVKISGDAALRQYTLKYDKVEIDNIAVPDDEIKDSEAKLSAELKRDIQTAAGSIASVSKAQQRPTSEVETFNGVRCWHEYKPIDKVGLYVPAGSAPLFSSVLMLAVPASVAGCPERILCSPPGKDGHINPAILYAADLAGATKIFRVGGIQAIAAMTLGTESIPQVYKICGPGNRYVTAAKQFATFFGAAIDMPAGPSELLLVADNNADPSLVAIDFLSQLEHGPDSQSLLVTTSKSLIPELLEWINKLLPLLSRRNIIERELSNCRIIYMNEIERAIDFANCYAPEHLSLHTDQCLEHAKLIRNAASVFVGAQSTVSAGDYISGTNHVLPTGGYAKAFSGVNLHTYMHGLYFQHINYDGVMEIAEPIHNMARFEGLDGHSMASTARL
ncbi:MAG: histidinol dehydrogenase [Tannerellaceae bacterium]|jgi:histidinol dehydrogenase|nr:histidinol dehydrogenase [Tannerellaceae bacterium]